MHRDIKPANIVLAAGGEVKVLDFGIARADGGSGTTRTQAVLGTPAYLAPEQASGQAAGPQADLYALGCVLFEMLTGTPPFSADTAMGVAYRHVHDDPGPPSARRPGLPGRLDQITARLLAKNPADRPSSAAAARGGLLSALNQDATASLPPLASDQAPGIPVGHRRWRPRGSEVVLAVALVATLAGLAAVLLTGSAPRRSATPPVTRPQIHPAVASTTHKPPAAHHKKRKPGQVRAGQRDAPGRRRCSRVRRRPASRSC